MFIYFSLWNINIWNLSVNLSITRYFLLLFYYLFILFNYFEFYFIYLFGLLKITAFGVFGYIRDGYNLFDGCIVLISMYEVLAVKPDEIKGQTTSGQSISVLRTFRLLRILKFIRFMPALRRQLMIMLKTMDNVATFFSLLILFIFIFRWDMAQRILKNLLILCDIL